MKSEPTATAAAIQQQLQALQPVLTRARQLYNSKLLTVSIWITAETNGEPFQELFHFPEPDTIPTQLKDFFADYCIMLVSLQQSLQKDFSRARRRKSFA